MGDLSDPELRRLADDYLAKCLDHGSAPHVNELAAKAGMSAGDFSNLFLDLVGERPSVYLKRGQIECAKQLLLTTHLELNEIAYRCGFRRRRTFFRLFKRLVGTTPAAYRAAQRT